MSPYAWRDISSTLQRGKDMEMILGERKVVWEGAKSPLTLCGRREWTVESKRGKEKW